MELGLKGRRALVTGSHRGTGAVIAQRLAEEGADVVVHGFEPDQAAAVADTIVGVGFLGSRTPGSGSMPARRGEPKFWPPPPPSACSSIHVCRRACPRAAPADHLHEDLFVGIMRK